MFAAGVTECQSWRCSTISIRRFCSRPSAVALLAIGSASARPSALTRAGSPTIARDDGAHRVGTRDGELEVRREAHGADRLVVGVVDHLERSRSRCSARRQPAPAAARDADCTTALPGANIERPAMRTIGVAGVPSRLTARSSMSG